MIHSLNADVVDEVLTERRPVELIDAARLASMLSVSPRTLYRLKEKGHLPEPIRLGGSVRWRRGDVEQWILDGCPSHQGGPSCSP